MAEKEIRDEAGGKKFFKKYRWLFVFIPILIFLCAGCGILTLVLVGNVNPYGSVWYGENSKKFENSDKIENLLEEVNSDKDFKLRYYVRHTDPDFKNSIYVEYVDEGFSLNDIEEYYDHENESGEFIEMGDALCEADFRDEFGYKVIRFKVKSAQKNYVYYENSLYCK
jgi:hypothetical protein